MPPTLPGHNPTWKAQQSSQQGRTSPSGSPRRSVTSQRDRTDEIQPAAGLGRLESAPPCGRISHRRYVCFVSSFRIHVVDQLGASPRLQSSLPDPPDTVRLNRIPPVPALSLYVASAAGAIVILVPVFGPAFTVSAPLVILDAWARVELGDHTPAQVVVGAVVGAAVATCIFQLLR